MSLRRRKPNIAVNTRNDLADFNNKNFKSQATCRRKCLNALLLSLCLIASVGLYGYVRAPFTSLTLNDLSVKVDLVGVLAPNKKLSKGIKITGLFGPESVAEDDKGNLYTGLIDGRIVKIAPSQEGVIGGGAITNLTSGHFPNVPKVNTNSNIGSPLGLRVQKDKLFIADAEYGIYSVDINTQQVEHLLKIGDIQLNFPNDLYVTKDGKKIYFTDSSSKYGLYNGSYIIPEGICDGRIIEYNTETQTAQVVLTSFCVCNGIQLSNDEKTMLIAESARCRVRIIDVTTWKTVKFVNVPMMPDNIRSTGAGTFWVVGPFLWTPSYGFLERNPVLRQILGGLLSSEQLSKISPNPYSLVLEVTENGKILQSLHDPDEKLTYGVSQATLLSDGRIALSSYYASFLSILDGKNVALGLD